MAKAKMSRGNTIPISVRIEKSVYEEWQKKEKELCIDEEPFNMRRALSRGIRSRIVELEGVKDIMYIENLHVRDFVIRTIQKSKDLEKENKRLRDIIGTYNNMARRPDVTDEIKLASKLDEGEKKMQEYEDENYEEVGE